MELHDRVVVVTGGANGIGRALCERASAEGARGVVVADLDAAGAQAVAERIGGLAVATDVSVESDVVALVRAAEQAFGPVEVFCANAGVAARGGPGAPDEDWQRLWDVNVMAHVYTARAVVPGMRKRGEGYLLGTISAAALVNHIDAAPYSVTKAAALSLYEWLAIAYGDEGVRVSCLCPQGVRTNMLASGLGGATEVMLGAGALDPEQVAAAVVDGLRSERFLILPHADVAEYFQRKATDYDRWLNGMRRLRRSVEDALGGPIEPQE